MSWKIAFFAAVGFLCAAAAGAVILKKRRIKPLYLLGGGVTLAAMTLFIPVYAQLIKKDTFYWLKVVLLSVHNTIRLFVVDGEFSTISAHTDQLSGWIGSLYSVLAAVLFVVAPLLTFGVVLSFFKNITAYKNYLLGYKKDAYIFSDLNERSLALAKSLKQNDPKRMIVFTDVFEKNEEVSYELVEHARALGALCFQKDIAVVNFVRHAADTEMAFFIIGEDSGENTKQAITLIRKYRNRERTSVYVVSPGVDSELLLSTTEKGKVKVRRINEVQALISRTLYDEGIRIFENACETENGDKRISAVIVGMGKYGTEMTKALSWFGQMDGYRLEMNVFDKKKNTKGRLSALCPELMTKPYNGDFTTEGEAHYKISVHAGIHTETKEFLDQLCEIPKLTYVFVALGDDEKNIEMAVRIRSWLAKFDIWPVIDAIVYNTDKKNALQGITNYSGQEYDIHFIGDLESSYSEKVILDSDVEAEALKRHLKWGEEEQFWKYEYNYRSSMASAIHKKMKILCKIPGADKPVEERTPEEREGLRVLEHNRWNAYMRSEGYTFDEKRNNLAKTHHCLVEFEKLSLKEQMKDDD